ARAPLHLAAGPHVAGTPIAAVVRRSGGSSDYPAAESALPAPASGVAAVVRDACDGRALRARETHLVRPVAEQAGSHRRGAAGGLRARAAITRRLRDGDL